MLYKTKIKVKKEPAQEFLYEADNLIDLQVKIYSHYSYMEEGDGFSVISTKETTYNYFEPAAGSYFFELKWSYETPDGKTIRETGAGWFDDINEALQHFKETYKIGREMFDSITKTKIVEYIN